ncbi:MAG: hypothetical protein HKO66_05885 [Saprospiraceae bacterium]|nr:hypothetical protein [Bacteroidia bacterium]NNE14363.1 hypothetical protein [Saprospiraceae bacterium]NNL91741.1 hypothetical protein [Saprospiraceae bacterium]
MKKLLLFSFFSLCLAFTSMAQTKFGAGATYYSDFGVQGRANLDLSDGIGLIPSFNYYFTEIGTSFSIDANATYDITVVGDDLPIYGFGGLGYYSFSFGGESSSEIGLNLGAGTEVGGNIYIEIGWKKFFCDFCGDDIGFAAGYYF